MNIIQALKPSRVRQHPPSIVPTQIIFHSACDNYGVDGHLNWQYSQDLESTFYVSGGGATYQIMEETWRAQANYTANRRSDGTGAISVETGSSIDATEPWTNAQVGALITLGQYLLNKYPTIARRVCRGTSDPGIGFHTMFGAPSPWTPVAKTCPGPARKQQFYDVIAPGIINGAIEKPNQLDPMEDEMAMNVIRDKNTGVDYLFSAPFVFVVIESREAFDRYLTAGIIDTPHDKVKQYETYEVEWYRDKIVAWRIAGGLPADVERVVPKA